MEKYNVLVYRNNDLWESLKDEIEVFASCEVFFTPGKPCPRQPGVNLKIKIFDASSTESDISKWVQENTQLLNDAEQVVADSTCDDVIYKECEIYSKNLNETQRDVLQQVFREKSADSVYREIFERLVENGEIEKFLICVDHIADYNPLQKQEFEDWQNVMNDIEKSQEYADMFANMIPCGPQVEFIRYNQVSVPQDGTCLIMHHHAIGKAGHPFQGIPRGVLMPYLERFIDGAQTVCDVSDIIVTEDVLDIFRKHLQPKED